jgi:hypothetical protein
MVENATQLDTSSIAIIQVVGISPRKNIDQQEIRILMSASNATSPLLLSFLQATNWGIVKMRNINR